MARQVQLRRGTTTEHSTFTGAVGEVTIDTDKDVVVVHDGATAGGFPMVKATSLATVATTGAYSDLTGTPTLATVATTGAYSDLTGKPSIPSAGTDFVAVTGGTFTGALNATSLVLSGDLTVNGTTTTINAQTLDVADLNITVASGAANPAAADGAGLTVAGASATLTYASATDDWNFNKSVTSAGLNVNGTTQLEDIKEKVAIDTSTSGTITMFCNQQGVTLYTTSQTANRTINFVGDGTTTLDSYLAVGQSVTVALAMEQGPTAYYLNAYQIDGSAVTPKWSGGSAPTGGNASSIDTYTFTIIKTGASTFTVLASLTQYA